jgi:hypothetical protein
MAKNPDVVGIKLDSLFIGFFRSFKRVKGVIGGGQSEI